MKKRKWINRLPQEKTVDILPQESMLITHTTVQTTELGFLWAASPFQEMEYSSKHMIFRSIFQEWILFKGFS